MLDAENARNSELVARECEVASASAPAGVIVSWPPNRVVTRAGDRQKQLHVLRKGWAMRIAPAVCGRKPVVSFLVPGDVFDIESFITGRKSTHSIRSLGGCQTEIVPFSSAMELWRAEPAFHALCTEHAAAHLSRLYTRLAALGCRDAQGRMAQLLLEFHQRLSAVGLVTRDAFECPVRQSQFADALGLTPVHVNRVLRRLQRDGLLVIEGRRFTLPEIGRLQRMLDEG